MSDAERERFTTSDESDLYEEKRDANTALIKKD